MAAELVRIKSQPRQQGAHSLSVERFNPEFLGDSVLTDQTTEPVVVVNVELTAGAEHPHVGMLASFLQHRTDAVEELGVSPRCHADGVELVNYQETTLALCHRRKGSYRGRW